MSIERNIERLLTYGIQHKLIEPLDIVQKRNELMSFLMVEEPYHGDLVPEEIESPVSILNDMLDYCYEKGIMKDNTITNRDLMDTKIMGILVDRQSNVARNFRVAYETSPKCATDYFYNLSQSSNYIRMDRVNKNLEWMAPTEYGDLKITVNMSKPEMDAEEIARMKNMKKASYPKCFLCYENVGYEGRLNHPARQTHRVIPMTLGGESWHLQYSPYVYYNEHCILFSEEHRPMLVEANTFSRMLDFVDQLPHYFIGGNAGLPIIGGSILSHDHYQGGNEVFPLEKAPIAIELKSKDYPEIEMGIVKWCMGTIRLVCDRRDLLEDCCGKILNEWVKYEDRSADIIPWSESGEQQNGITPVVRKDGDKYVVHIIFRNNRTTEERPDGIFHPNPKLHHIKKEGIGVIEVMGQAILPARLNLSFEAIIQILEGKVSYEPEAFEDTKHQLYPHREWIKDLVKKHGQKLDHEKATEILHNEVGAVYAEILEDAGVFKWHEKGQNDFLKFLNSLEINQ